MSLSFYNDGVITYSAPKGRFRKQFRKLEKTIGLNFERVKGYPDAEIMCRYKDLTGRSYAGMASPWTKYFDVVADERYKGMYHIEAHEIGHALGLSHREDCHSAMDTNWCYERKYLSKSDRAEITELFFG